MRETVRSSRVILARGVMLMAAGMAALLLLVLALELIVGGASLDFFNMDEPEAQQLNNLMARNLNQLLAVMFTTVAIAVALTGNSYSIKFLEFFIRDPINALALSLVVFADLNNTWIGFSLRDDYVPGTQLAISFVMTLLCFSLIFPYLYYVFRFLHPNSLLERLEQQFQQSLAGAARQPNNVSRYRQQLSDSIEHIANIAVRSIDRDDRNTAISSVHSLAGQLASYWQVKPDLPQAWFESEPDLFMNFSAAAVADFNRNHSWVEMKTFAQIQHVMQAAIPEMTEISSNVGRNMHNFSANPRAGAANLRIIVQYMNSFLRLTLNRRDVRSAFTILEQYRLIAESLVLSHPELVADMAYYIEYYGGVAREMHLDFVTELAAHDLGTLVQTAYEARAPNRTRLLDRMLEFDGGPAAALPGVQRAVAILGSYFRLAGNAPEAQQVLHSLSPLDNAALTRLKQDLLSITEQEYWEITERRVNIDYVPEEQRAELMALLDQASSVVSVSPDSAPGLARRSRRTSAPSDGR